MRVFHIVSSGDAQSIPLELALKLPLPESDLRVAVFSGDTSFGRTDDEPRVINLNASSANDWSAARRLRQAINDYDPDIIHVHHAASSFWGSWAGRMGRRNSPDKSRRIILKTEHNDRHHQGLKNDLVNLATYPLLDGVICNSDATRASLKPIECRLIKNRAWTIYNGVDVSKVQVASAKGQSDRVALGLPEGKFCLGAVGRFVEQKNYSVLLKAMTLAVAKGAEDLNLILIGAGPLETVLRSEADVLGLSDRVIFTGAKSRDEVYRYLGAMDGFVMPSLWEGFCNAAVEAMAAGLPLIASDLPVLREVLGDGESEHGHDAPLYFDATSPDAIAKAIGRIYGLGIEQRTHAGARNQTRAARYDIGIAADNYMKLYKSLMRGECPAP